MNYNDESICNVLLNIIEVRLEVQLQFEYNRKAIHESICHRVIIAIVLIIATCLCIYFKLDSRL